MDQLLKDLLTFRKMLTPLIIQVLFWIGVTAAILSGLGAIVAGFNAPFGGGAIVFGGLVQIVLGPILIRVFCELAIVFFTINDTLTDIKNSLKNRTNI